MTEASELVAHTSRELLRTVDAFVSEVVARAPAGHPSIATAFTRRLVDETAAELGRAVAAYVQRGGAGTSLGFANLVLTPERVADVVGRTREERGLSQEEVDVLTASLCGVPRRYLGRVLNLPETTIRQSIRSAIQKTGHQHLDDAVWSLRMNSR